MHKGIKESKISKTYLDLAKINLEMTVENGKGYVASSELRKNGDETIGMLVLDSLFSPV